MNWLDRYLHWTRTLESPTRYHYWSALTVAGHVLGRNVWMIRMGGKWCNFPGQLMTVLVGPTTVKKDTAMNQAVRLLKAMPKGTTNVLPSKTSPQELLSTQLAVNGPKRPMGGFICTGEMGTFFSNESFMDQMVTLITELWNAETGFVNPVTHEIEPIIKNYKFKSWSAELRDPFIGGLMAITPEGIAAELPASARKRGFMGRVLWVYEAASDRAPDPGTSWDEDEGTERDILMEGLEKLAMLRGPVWFTKQGREWFDHWYINVHSPAAASASEEAQETGYVGRKAEHVLRVAMILAAIAYVSDENPQLAVRVVDLEKALSLLTTTERMLPRVIGEVGRSPHAEKMQRLLHYLEKAPRARVACLRYLWKYGVKDKDDFNRLIDYALEMKMVAVDEGSAGVVYRLVRGSGQMLRAVK